MTPKDRVHQSENFLKGKIGENIVSFLLRELGFEVTPNGVESTHASYITHMQKGRLDRNQIKKYRSRADLTALREAGNGRKSLFAEIEVKYSSRSYIEKDKLRHYDDDVRFIFVDRHDFWSTTKDQIFCGKNAEKTFLGFKSFTRLEDDPFYGFSTAEKKLIKDYKRLISRYYADKNGDTTETDNTDKSKSTTAPPPKHMSGWTDDDDTRLLEYHKLMRRKLTQDEMIAGLAKDFGRSEKAIRMRLEKILSSS
jgi:hypothetical protein